MKNFIGIPFKDGEPTYMGANFITLIELYYKDYLNIEIPKIRVESANTRRAFMEYLKQISDGWVETKEPKPFDVVAMSRDIKHPNMIQHFGILLENGKILHTLEKAGSHIVDEKDLKSFIKGYYRWH